MESGKSALNEGSVALSFRCARSGAQCVGTNSGSRASTPGSRPIRNKDISIINHYGARTSARPSFSESRASVLSSIGVGEPIDDYRKHCIRVRESVCCASRSRNTLLSIARAKISRCVLQRALFAFSDFAEGESDRVAQTAISRPRSSKNGVIDHAKFASAAIRITASQGNLASGLQSSLPRHDPRYANKRS